MMIYGYLYLSKRSLALLLKHNNSRYPRGFFWGSLGTLGTKTLIYFLIVCIQDWILDGISLKIWFYCYREVWKSNLEHCLNFSDTVRDLGCFIIISFSIYCEFLRLYFSLGAVIMFWKGRNLVSNVIFGLIPSYLSSLLA